MKTKSHKFQNYSQRTFSKNIHSYVRILFHYFYPIITKYLIIMPRNNSPKTVSAKKAKRSPRKPGLISNGIKKKLQPHKVFTLKSREGFIFAWVSKSFNDKKAAYISPLIDKIKNNHDSIEHLNIIGVSARKDSSQENRPMLSDGYKFLQLVSIIEDDNEGNIEEWGEEIVIALNKCKNDFKYPSIFEYGGDLTPQNEESPIMYLLDEDMYEYVHSLYAEAISDDSLAGDSETQKNYLGLNIMSIWKKLVNEQDSWAKLC